MKVLIESNYWKKIGPIEILVVFSELVMEMKDELALSQNQHELVLVFDANLISFDYVEVNVLFELMYRIIVLFFLFFWKWKTTCRSL